MSLKKIQKSIQNPVKVVSELNILENGKLTKRAVLMKRLI